jgi:hypothetical protein
MYTLVRATRYFPLCVYTKLIFDKNVKWTKVSGSLSQISFDGTNLCGTKNEEIWCASKGVQEGKPELKKLQGSLVYVSVSNGQLMGVNKNHEVFFSKSMNEVTPWQMANGKLRQISMAPVPGTGSSPAFAATGDFACGVTFHDEVYCARDASNPQWKRVSGILKQVATDATGVIGVAGDGKVYYSKNSMDVWLGQMNGVLNQISIDDNVACGTSKDKVIYCRDLLKGDWVKVPGTLSQVEIGNGRLYAVNDLNQVWFAPDYKVSSLQELLLKFNFLESSLATDSWQREANLL